MDDTEKNETLEREKGRVPRFGSVAVWRMERFERFQFSVPAFRLRRGFLCVFQYSLTERTVPVSVPGKRFRRFRFRVRFLGKQFRRFRFPVPVRFLGRPERVLVGVPSTKLLEFNPCRFLD